MKQCSKLLIPALLCAAPTFAQPFSTLDARSMAMGDIGVASSKSGTAGIFNPALLSDKASEDSFHIVLPNIGLSAFADPDALDAFSDLLDNGYIDNISTGLQGMENSGNDINQFAASKNLFVEGVDGFNTNLSELSDKPFRINIAAFTALSIPTETLGVSVFLNANATIETSPIYADCDEQILRDYTAALANINQEADLITLIDERAGCQNQLIVDSSDITNIIFNDPTTDLQSRVILAGVTITELGVALSHKFQSLDGLSIGITPKFMSITSYADAPTIEELEDDYDADNLTDSETTNEDFNIDLGFSYSFLPNDMMTVGLTIKNLLPQTYKTELPLSGIDVIDATFQEFDIDTQARAGLAVDLPLGFTIATDIDLTKNKPYFLGEDTQFFGAGVEWDVWLMQLRGGFRTNLADSNDQVITAGLGFNFVVLQLDIGAQFSDNNVGGAIQLGVAF
ncbi:MAG: conjugal transfer protein TraF [Pseudomonadales bacterium]|nr:conjugal transfer protein TraF [Pseudomonadales bacterium]